MTTGVGCFRPEASLSINSNKRRAAKCSKNPNKCIDIIRVAVFRREWERDGD